MLPGRSLDIQIFHAIVAGTRANVFFFCTFFPFLFDRRIKRGNLFPWISSILFICNQKQSLLIVKRYDRRILSFDFFLTDLG